MSNVNFWSAQKRVTRINAQQRHALDAHQVVYYNTGESIALIDGIPLHPRGTLTEADYNIVVRYTDNVLIEFEGAGPHQLLIIEKTYYVR